MRSEPWAENTADHACPSRTQLITVWPSLVAQVEASLNSEMSAVHACSNRLDDAINLRKVRPYYPMHDAINLRKVRRFGSLI